MTKKPTTLSLIQNVAPVDVKAAAGAMVAQRAWAAAARRPGTIIQVSGCSVSE